MKSILSYRGVLLVVLGLALTVGALGTAASARALYVLARPSPYDPNKVPFPYDPNSIQGTLLGTVTHRAGLERTIKCSYDDPDGDPVVVALAQAPAGMVIGNDPNTFSYTLTWKPDREGVYPVVVSATDVPISGQPHTVTGTILWNVLPENRGPFLHPVDNVSFAR